MCGITGGGLLQRRATDVHVAEGDRRIVEC